MKLPWRFYRGNTAWVPPMLFDVRTQTDPKRGEFFKHSQAEFFLARRGDDVVGRIAAMHNQRHLDAHADGAGFFGFFECEDNAETARALLETAEAWLRGRGLTVARGPANFSIQDEAGVLLDGFEHAPMAGMGYTPPYYRALIEAAGYTKAKDLLVCRIDWAHWNTEQYDRIIAVTSRMAPGVNVRELNMADLPGEAGRLAEVFAEAWRENWGAQPISQAEFLKYAEQYRLFIDPRTVLFAEKDGETLAIMVAIPDMNEIIQRIDGRMFPLGWWHLLTKRKKLKGIRLFLLGVKKKARILGLPALFMRNMHALLKQSDYQSLEFSWILEDNKETLALVNRLGGHRVQTLRLYDKAL
ncbi:N-acetyltransferase [Rariglobus hedericola]|uniref:N-acetyltransferase n=1 Tax=Rariglobus hedericola TaxID=2597822 RepID=A0A556QQV9_9BACT|nr:N-acetyltransferase [Rariglobus hedericola]TSJ79026.1 N-acetyltransferase [Rariglobus hedericola]